jgi:6-phosphofructokinase 1
MKERGINVICVPKTIDNDIPGTEVTFGFDSAMTYATEAVDRLHLTAESHDRIMVIEVMGRDAGFIALHAGLAGGADAILLPEIPFDMRSVANKVLRRKASLRHFSIVVVAEGAHPTGQEKFFKSAPGGASSTLGGVGFHVAGELAEMTGVEARCTVLGHLLRGGAPSATDRILATRFGSATIDLIQQDAWGRMVAIVDGQVGSVPLSDVGESPTRTVDLEGDVMRAARGLGIVFGDES